MSGVKGIIGIHRFNFCLVVVLSLSCSGVKTHRVSCRISPFGGGVEGLWGGVA